MTEIFVAPAADFKVGSRHLIRAGNRNIAVFHLRGGYYAVDNACYHHGGPLVGGDIEMLGGHPCVICPWHSFRIALDTGEGYYWAVVDSAKTLKSKGPRQRTHRVFEKDGAVVCVVGTEASFDSDHYAEMDLANRESPGPVSAASTALAHSGLMLHSRTTGPTESCTIVCSGVEAVSADRMAHTFTMTRQPTAVRGTGWNQRLEAGMWVELEIPTTPPARRKWTVTRVDAKHAAGWFDITVKRRDVDASRSVSQWMMENAREKVFKLVRAGGSFTVQAMRPRIANHRGRLVMLSAGIGITPMYASLGRYLNDLFTVQCGPPLFVLHLHADRAVSTLPFAPSLSQWATGLAAGDEHRPVTYTLKLFLSRDADGVIDGADVHRGRLRPETVAPTIAEVFGTLKVPVMLCGPPEFMAAMQAALVNDGIEEGFIENESFY